MNVKHSPKSLHRRKKPPEPPPPKWHCCELQKNVLRVVFLILIGYVSGPTLMWRGMKWCSPSLKYCSRQKQRVKEPISPVTFLTCWEPLESILKGQSTNAMLSCSSAICMQSVTMYGLAVTRKTLDALLYAEHEKHWLSASLSLCLSLSFLNTYSLSPISLSELCVRHGDRQHRWIFHKSHSPPLPD